jgi:hypothetical protein
MSGSFLNGASEQFADMASATKRALREMQRTPIGTEERSGQEQGALWRKMRLLPDADFNSMLDAAAEKVGHKNDEEAPCQVCSFVLRHAEREGKR